MRSRLGGYFYGVAGLVSIGNAGWWALNVYRSHRSDPIGECHDEAHRCDKLECTTWSLEVTTWKGLMATYGWLPPISTSKQGLCLAARCVGELHCLAAVAWKCMGE